MKHLKHAFYRLHKAWIPILVEMPECPDAVCLAAFQEGIYDKFFFMRRHIQQAGLEFLAALRFVLAGIEIT